MTAALQVEDGTEEAEGDNEAGQETSWEKFLDDPNLSNEKKVDYR